MIKNYFTNTAGDPTSDEDKREMAVAAALEIAKASVSSADAGTSCKTDDEMRYVSEHLSALADAIQNALK